jgi:CyaY protein
MNEAEFHQQVTRILLRLEQAVEDSGLDIDFENAGDILTLEFANGSKIIVNKQAAANQIWVAARAGGFHYSFDADKKLWLNDQNGEELFAQLSHLASQQAGVRIDLR